MAHSESELQGRVARFTSSFRRAGVKLTPQRIEVFRELAGRVDHPDADAVFRAVAARMPMVSLDTVYRTLWLLAEMRLIQTLGPRREVARFDSNLDRHHHYVCMGCGLVRDFDSKALDALRIPDAARRLGSIMQARVEVRGLCAACQKKAAAGEPRTKGRSTR